MKNMTFDTGEISVAIQGDENRILKFNPSDTAFQGRLFDMLENIQDMAPEMMEKGERQDEIEKNMSPAERVKSRNKFNAELDEIITNEIDSVFYSGASEIIFGDVSPTARVASGEFVFSCFFNALLEYIKPELESREKKMKDIARSLKRK